MNQHKGVTSRVVSPLAHSYCHMDSMHINANRITTPCSNNVVTTLPGTSTAGGVGNNTTSEPDQLNAGSKAPERDFP